MSEKNRLEVVFAVPLHALCGAGYYRVVIDGTEVCIVKPLPSEKTWPETELRAHTLGQALITELDRQQHEQEITEQAEKLAIKWRGQVSEPAIADLVETRCRIRAEEINDQYAIEQYKFLIEELGAVAADNAINHFAKL